ncbi:MAG: serine hydrolase [Myxococcales bacterium]|nr:serine hydrolase [Myxococcales bacterium]MDD9969679.1 serine hydrolase [Myxococcales bacterium]
MPSNLGRFALGRRSVGVAIFFACVPMGCLPDDRMKIPYNDAPRAIGDDWKLSSPGAEGFDVERLQAVYRDFFHENRFPTAISLLVVRHGALVAEGYCRDLDDIRRLNAIQSATKSLTSLLTGIAIDEGSLEGEGQRVHAVIPDKFDDDPKKRTMTIENLLTMRTGLDFDNERFSIELLIDGQQDSLAYILDKPLKAPPGADFDYMDASPHLLAGVIQRAVGMSLEDFARSRLFEPLGIERLVWETYADGVTYGAVGLYLVPRDLAKIGLLALQQGHWRGQQLVSRAWMERSTRGRVDTPFSPSIGYRYGYYWWTTSELGGFSADGHGGQFIFVVHDLDLVVVMTAEPHTTTEVGAINLDDFDGLVRRIIGAVAR